MPPFPPPPAPPSYPVSPGVTYKGYFPVVITNNTGVSPDKVYLLSFSPQILSGPGITPANSAMYRLLQTFPGQVISTSVTESVFSPSYSFTLSQFPNSTTGGPTNENNNDFLLYFPIGAQSVRIYVSLEQPMYCNVSTPVGGQLTMNSPPAALFNDPNFNVIYDFLELTLTPLSQGNLYLPVQPFLDTSQVDSLGMSIQLALYKYDSQSPTTSQQFIVNGTATTNIVGYSQDRATLFSDLDTNLTLANPWGKLMVPFYSNPYDPTGSPSTYLRVFSTKTGAGGAAGQVEQPKGGLYTVPQFPNDFLSNPIYGKFGKSFLKSMFDYYFSVPLYIQADQSFKGTGEVYHGTVSGIEPNRILKFAATSSSYVIIMNEADITVSGMYSGTPAVSSSNAPAADQLLVSAYVSCAFVTGLLGNSGVFDAPANPLNAANLQNHILALGYPPFPTPPLVPYYGQNPFGASVPGASVPGYDLFAKLLHQQAYNPTSPPYPNANVPSPHHPSTPQTGLCYAFDYDDKLGISSTVATPTQTPKSDMVFAKYILNPLNGPLPTGVFDDSTPLTLQFTLPPNVSLGYVQGLEGENFIPISNEQTITGAICTESNPFRIRYQSGDGTQVVYATLYPKFQFCQPNYYYRQVESDIISGVQFTPTDPSDTNPTAFTITFGGF